VDHARARRRLAALVPERPRRAPRRRARELALGTRFTWQTFGVAVASTVREFVPAERIAWDGRGTLLDVYHAWLIEPRGPGAWVLTEESQNGLAARAQALFMPKRMWRGHQLWLERLKAEAERG